MLYIAAYRGKSLFPSQAIEWMTWSKYSHLAISQEMPDSFSIIEAWYPGGVQESHSFGKLHEKNTRVDLFRFILPLSEEEENAIMAAMRSKLGCPYDWRGVLSFVLRRRMQKDGAFFCSELVAWACNQANRPILAGPVWKIAPGDVTKSPELVFDHATYC